MAAGSSAPELFTSVAGVGTDSDVGVGTIVGYIINTLPNKINTDYFPRSAMFNILVILALSSILAGQVRVHLSRIISIKCFLDPAFGLETIVSRQCCVCLLDSSVHWLLLGW